LKTVSNLRGAALGFALAASVSNASSLVYTPNNPNFGGNPENGVNLLNEANAQNKYTNPSLSNYGTPPRAARTFVPPRATTSTRA
jgi:curli production assembly/transport component CsgF